MVLTTVITEEVKQVCRWVHHHPNQMYEKVPAGLRRAHRRAEKSGFIYWVGPAEGWIITDAGARIL